MNCQYYKVSKCTAIHCYFWIITICLTHSDCGIILCPRCSELWKKNHSSHQLRVFCHVAKTSLQSCLYEKSESIALPIKCSPTKEHNGNKPLFFMMSFGLFWHDIHNVL